MSFTASVQDFLESLATPEGQEPISREEAKSWLIEDLTLSEIELCLPSVRRSLRDQFIQLHVPIQTGRGVPILRAIANLYPPDIRAAWLQTRSGVNPNNNSAGAPRAVGHGTSALQYN